MTDLRVNGVPAGRNHTNQRTDTDQCWTESHT
jgi:hypothetical protein